MAISIDQSVSDNSSFSSAGGTLTKSLTIGSGAKILLCAFYGNNTNAPDSVTWNGSAMTQAPGSPVSDGGNRIYVYYIVNPASGTHNCVIDAGAGCNVQQASYASYFGVDDAAPIDANVAGSVGAATSSAQAVTTNTANAFVVGYHQHSANEVSSAGASTTQRSSDNGATLGASNGWYDRGPVVSPGSTALNVSWVTSATFAAVVLALKEAAVATNIPNKVIQVRQSVRRAAFY